MNGERVTLGGAGQGARDTCLYVAGPMTGLPEFNYPAFRRAGEQLQSVGYRVLNPVDAEQHNPTPGKPQSWDWYMRHALRMVLDAQGIALLPGWQHSKGARLEVSVAHRLKIPVRMVPVWIERAQVLGVTE